MKKTNEKGITLIALSVTVILMIILAEIGISTSKSSNDIINLEKDRTATFQKEMNQHMNDIKTLSDNVNKTTNK